MTERTTEEQAPIRHPLVVQPVTPERWRDLFALFERKGPRGGTPMTAGCWCMWWRRRTGAAASNRRAMQSLVREGRVPGLLAYEEGEPVGWVSVAPREDFGQLVGSRTYGPPEAEPGVWSIVCFYVDPRAKKQGVREALLEAAVDQAFRGGARAIEAYPHVDGDYMGSPTAFKRKGFVRVRQAGKRVVMRRESQRR